MNTGIMKGKLCFGAPFPNNIVFKTQVCITQDMSTISRKFFLFMHSGLRCYFIPKMPSPWASSTDSYVNRNKFLPDFASWVPLCDP